MRGYIKKEKKKKLTAYKICKAGLSSKFLTNKQTNKQTNSNVNSRV